MMNRANRIGMKQPMVEPNLRCRPDLVKGMPIFRLILALAWEIPRNLFQEKPPRFIGLVLEVLNVGTYGLMEAGHRLYHRFVNLGPAPLLPSPSLHEWRGLSKVNFHVRKCTWGSGGKIYSKFGGKSSTSSSPARSFRDTMANREASRSRTAKLKVG